MRDCTYLVNVAPFDAASAAAVAAAAAASRKSVV
jgi:hypothetical protein